MTRVAITSAGLSTASVLDERFGHCACFVIFDRLSGAIEILPNPYQDTQEQAGILAARLLISKGVKQVVSREFGQGVKPLFDAHKIQMIRYNKDDATVEGIIQMFNLKA